MPRWSPVANTICYGKIEGCIKDWLDMAPLMEWVSYAELVSKVSMSFSQPSQHIHSEISRACKHLEQDIHYLERYPTKRTRLIRRLY